MWVLILLSSAEAQRYAVKALETPGQLIQELPPASQLGHANKPLAVSTVLASLERVLALTLSTGWHAFLPLVS